MNSKNMKSLDKARQLMADKIRENISGQYTFTLKKGEKEGSIIAHKFDEAFKKIETSG